MALATRSIIVATLFAAMILALPAAAVAQGGFREDFEGPEVTWKLIDADTDYNLGQHRRREGEGHRQSGCELVQTTAANGTFIYAMHQVPESRIIDELRIGLWLRSDRPAIQLMARVVLPNASHPRDGQPISTYLRGPSYSNVGGWQQLRFESITSLFAHQVRALRLEHGPNIDVRDAYIDQLVVNVYGGPGSTSVWFDDLEMAGVFPRERRVTQTVANPTTSWQGEPGRQRPNVEFDGAALMIDNRAVFPRMIRHNGEPLEWLRRLGFNMALTTRPPTVELLDEARRTGMWLVSPPPWRPVDESAEESRRWSEVEISSRYDPVLAWYLGDDLIADQIPIIRNWSEQIRRADRQRTRPLICHAETGLRGFSRHANVLLTRRQPLGTTLELNDYVTWLRQRPGLARPGTPTWTAIQTQLPTNVSSQLDALPGFAATGVPPSATYEQVRLLVYAAMASGMQGLCFESYSRLDTDDNTTRLRAATLELINHELDLIEPWASSGQLLTTVPGPVPQVHASIVQVNRARLLIPLWIDRGAQFVPGQSAGRDITLLVPGVPESHQAYWLDPSGIRPIHAPRVAGGKRVTFDEFDLTACALLVQENDPRLLTHLRSRMNATEQRAAALSRELLVGKLKRVTGIIAGLDPTARREAAESEWLGTAQKHLAQCDNDLAAGQFASAYTNARRGMRPLRMYERTQWLAAINASSSPMATPFTVSFSTLPAHWTLLSTVNHASFGGNRLAGANFENLEELLALGWRHVVQALPDVETEAGLSPEGAHGGRYSLRISCRPRQGHYTPQLVESSPAWVTSAPVSVDPGQWVRIQGWVRIPAPLTGTVDGLMIYDSEAGRSLAERFGATQGWQQFTMYRGASLSGQIHLTFELTGLGEVWIDDVTIEALEARPPGATPAFGPPPARSAAFDRRVLQQ